MNMRRREFFAAMTALSSAAYLPARVFARDEVEVVSPDGRVRFQLFWRDQPRLTYAVSFRNRPAIERSPLGMILDGVDLGQGVEVGHIESYRVKDRYPWRGVHS